MIDSKDGYSFIRLSESDKFKAIDTIIETCHIFDCLPDRMDFKRRVHEREKLLSTGIGHGVAITHGLIPHLEHARIALGILDEGIAFDNKYPEPVTLIFVMASGEDHPDDYLKTMSSILRWVHDDSFNAKLKRCEFEDEKVQEFLTSVLGV